MDHCDHCRQMKTIRYYISPGWVYCSKRCAEEDDWWLGLLTGPPTLPWQQVRGHGGWAAA